MNVVYFGSGSFGLPTLERVAAEHRVVLVVTQPDRPAGRRRRVTPTPVAQYATDHGLELLKAHDVNTPDTADTIRSAADVFVVVAFGQKLGRTLLDGVFAINLHASLLPRYRGAAPINWAMMNGDAESGVSVITITQRMDAGDVVGQMSTPIDPMETAGELEQRLALMGPDVVAETLRRYKAGELHPVPQNERSATRAPKLSKSDGTVRFDESAAAVQSRVHGLNPWPGCNVELDGRHLKLGRVEVVVDGVPDSDAGTEPGRVLDDGTVACATGRVRLLAVTPAGGKSMSFDDYLHGHRSAAGGRLQPARGPT